MKRSTTPRTFLLLLVSVLVVLICAAPARAGQVLWKLSVPAMTDGGSLSGWFVYDPTTSTVTSWSITGQLSAAAASTVTPPPTNPFTFEPGLPGTEAALVLPGPYGLGLEDIIFDYDTGLPDPHLRYRVFLEVPVAEWNYGLPGTATLITGDYYVESITGIYVGQEATTSALNGAYITGTAVPLPPSAMLLGTGLLGLAGAGFRKRWRK
jgi:hypothetical protein